MGVGAAVVVGGVVGDAGCFSSGTGFFGSFGSATDAMGSGAAVSTAGGSVGVGAGAASVAGAVGAGVVVAVCVAVVLGLVGSASSSPELRINRPTMSSAAAPTRTPTTTFCIPFS